MSEHSDAEGPEELPQGAEALPFDEILSAATQYLQLDDAEVAAHARRLQHLNTWQDNWFRLQEERLRSFQDTPWAASGRLDNMLLDDAGSITNELPLSFRIGGWSEDESDSSSAWSSMAWRPEQPSPPPPYESLQSTTETPPPGYQEMFSRTSLIMDPFSPKWHPQ